MEKKILLGNEAISLGLVEQGCRVVTAYPGTPSSEILAGVVKQKKQYGRKIYTEWSTNEKVAFEVALAASWAGLRAAVAMKQVGLNVAADPLFSAAYTGVRGGFVVIAADDPGPHSSQTEQDSRLMALNAKVPVFDPSTPQEAHLMVEEALELSERFAIPVLLRPTTRICHGLQSLAVQTEFPPDADILAVRFRKDPPRWAATPKFRHLLHKELNQKLGEIESVFEGSPLNQIVHAGSSKRLGIIASGAVFNTVLQALSDLGVQVPVLKIGTPHPLPRGLTSEFIAELRSVLVIEEPGACIELQIPERGKVLGRLNGFVPNAGELTPEVVFAVLADGLGVEGFEVNLVDEDAELRALIDQLPLPVRRPRLCPGCSHRSAFFAMKKTFGPKAIYPGDIGCYTLGANLRAVDTIVDMGGSVAMANGFYHANKLVGDKRPIIAAIGDSTFLHSGVVPLINAVHSRARFVLVILDNHTTAMTGFQPTAESDHLADGSKTAGRVSIEKIVQACGVGFVEVTDPYDQEAFSRSLEAAYEHTRAPQGGVAVLIANRPCVLYDPLPVQEHPIPVFVTEECDGCRYCLEAFECPAILLAADGSRVDIDRAVCIDCGQCIDACYKGFILPSFAAHKTEAEVVPG